MCGVAPSIAQFSTSAKTEKAQFSIEYLKYLVNIRRTGESVASNVVVSQVYNFKTHVTHIVIVIHQVPHRNLPRLQLAILHVSMDHL